MVMKRAFDDDTDMHSAKENFFIGVHFFFNISYYILKWFEFVHKK